MLKSCSSVPFPHCSLSFGVSGTVVLGSVFLMFVVILCLFVFVFNPAISPIRTVRRYGEYMDEQLKSLDNGNYRAGHLDNPNGLNGMDGNNGAGYGGYDNIDHTDSADHTADTDSTVSTNDSHASRSARYRAGYAVAPSRKDMDTVYSAYNAGMKGVELDRDSMVLHSGSGVYDRPSRWARGWNKLCFWAVKYYIPIVVTIALVTWVVGVIWIVSSGNFDHSAIIR